MVMIYKYCCYFKVKIILCFYNQKLCIFFILKCISITINYVLNIIIFIHLYQRLFFIITFKFIIIISHLLIHMFF